MINYILLNIFFILGSIYILYKSKHSYHMLQLESYKNERYIKWIKNNTTIKIKELILLITSIILIFNNKLGLITNIIWMIILLVCKTKYIEKKPLVITARIKRMYITEVIILLLILAFANLYNIYISILINILIIFSYIYILIINIVNTPLEKSIQLKFYKKAKKKLRENLNLKTIGITGSYGKTSTKYILKTILSQKFNTLMTPESYNTTMGVVKTINEELNNTHEIFICEMGAKNIGDIKEICDLVNPTFGILTAIGPQHLKTFKTIENVKKTKMELIESLPKEGISFVNNEDENIKEIKFQKNNVKFGLDKDCDYYADNIEVNECGSSFDIHIKKYKTLKVKTKLLGIHNIINIIGAVAVANELGLTEEEIVMGIRYLKPVTHRLELKQNQNGPIIIDDAYNSNIKGACAALEVLKSFKKMQRILITPGIVELGDKTEMYNKIFGNQAAKSSDYIILVGAKQTKFILEGIKEEKYKEDNIYMAQNLEDALTKMRSIANSDTVVLFENDLPDNYL